MKPIIILIIIIFILSLLPQSVSAIEYTAPVAPDDVVQYIPENSNNFSQDLLYVVQSVFTKTFPDLSETLGTCISLIAVTMLLSIGSQFSKTTKRTFRLIATLGIGSLIVTSNHSLIHLGTETIDKMASYGKLLLPAITAATAANGSATTSAAISGGTFLFINLLTTLIAKLLIPLIYIYMAICFADCASPTDMFQKLKKSIKNFITWFTKIVLLIFTTYMSITGAISGSVDSSAIKAAKLAINGVVPIVGSAISDASETILLSAKIAKNAIGIYGLLTIIAICLGPFLKIGINYLLLKVTSSITGIFADKNASTLIEDLSNVMGIILALTSATCILLLISITCFIRSTV